MIHILSYICLAIKHVTGRNERHLGGGHVCNDPSLSNRVSARAVGNLRHDCVEGRTSQCSQERSGSKIIAHGAEMALSPDVDEAMVRT